MGHLGLAFSVVKQTMKRRWRSRRFRRYRKTPQRPMRFLHRTGHKISPSMKANRELERRGFRNSARLIRLPMGFMKVSKPGTPSPSVPSWSVNNGNRDRLAVLLPLEPRHGRDTAQVRLALGLHKTAKKAERSAASHAVENGSVERPLREACARGTMARPPKLGESYAITYPGMPRHPSLVICPWPMRHGSVSDNVRSQQSAPYRARPDCWSKSYPPVRG